MSKVVESGSLVLSRRGSLLPLALLGVGAAVLSLLAGHVGLTSAATQDFPPLVMVWRDTANYGINGTPGSQTFRLDYTDRCHQRVTLLEHTALPDVAGSYTQVDGQTEITHDPRHRPDEVRAIGPANCWPPDRYLLVPIAMGSVQEMVMIADRNHLITDAAALNYLRQERNERAHGTMPSEEERRALLRAAPTLAGLYVDYIAFFANRTTGIA